MSLTAIAPSPPPLAARRDGPANADGQRAGPTGQGLFSAAADLLAAARALAANAGASDSDIALGPALACMEASLEALAEAAERIGDESSTEEATEPMPLPMPDARFGRLADALRSAAGTCNGARRAAATNL
jgi:hypothetical protein